MSIEPISPLTQILPASELGDVKRLSFADFIKNEITSTEKKIAVAEKNVQDLALGNTDNLHQVMLSISKAQTAFEFVLQVRNKALEAYQEIMKTQI